MSKVTRRNSNQSKKKKKQVPSLMTDSKGDQLEQAVQWAIKISQDNSHGYNNTVGYNFGPGDFDCGGFITCALRYAGILQPTDYYEPNDGMEQILVTRGFEARPFNAADVKRGDVLYRYGHTELAISNTETVGAHSNYDGVPGDSSHNEINVSANVLGGGWTTIYRYGNGASGNNRLQPSLDLSKSYKVRTKSPSGENNRCYISNLYGAPWSQAWNTAIYGEPSETGANVLRNCVGYAQGRALEIYCEATGYEPDKTQTHPFVALNCNAGEFVNAAQSSGLKVSQDPSPGAIMVWQQPGNAGHVAVVEEVIDKDTVLASESGYGSICGTDWISHKRYRGTDKNWSGDLFIMGGYNFIGFVVNPAGAASTSGVSSSSTTTRGEVVKARALTSKQLENIATNFAGYDITVEYEDVKVTKTFQGITTADIDTSKAQGPQLLSFPALVESPFCILQVGDTFFGSYIKAGNLSKISYVKYPNFITGMQVQKVNGTVNQYTINLVYQIEAGTDPNFVDKVLSKVGYGKVYISYGDWASPTFVYRTEEAIITNVKSKVDFSNARISYTVSCTSNSIALASTTFNFAARKARPSDVMFEMLQDKQYGLTEMFPGMTNISQVRSNGLIASDDKEVQLESKEAMNPLSYLNYLVSCMSATSNSGDSIIRDSVYYLTIDDNSAGKMGGPFFKVVKVQSGTNVLASGDIYSVDVGFPSQNLVMDFVVNDENSWSLLYNYAEEVNNQLYAYSLDDKGRVVNRYSPNLVTSSKSFISTEVQKTWWTNMTQFPITATLTIKGLIRPAMLMTYVRVNAFFYGQRHISSGLYVITKQVDTIDGTGYRTVLTLVRIGGADDYITSVTKEVTIKKPTFVLKKNDQALIDLYNNKILKGNTGTMAEIEGAGKKGSKKVKSADSKSKSKKDESVKKIDSTSRKA